MLAVDGSFVSANTAEKLYVINVNECGRTHRIQNWETQRWVVLRGGQVVAEVVNGQGGWSLSRVVDLDSDGRNEVLVTGGMTGQGALVMSAWLISLEPRSFTTIKDFGSIYEGNCANLSGDPKEETYSIVHAQVCPGSPPEFTLEEKKGRCR